MLCIKLYKCVVFKLYLYIEGLIINNMVTKKEIYNCLDGLGFDEALLDEDDMQKLSGLLVKRFKISSNKAEQSVKDWVKGAVE